MPARLRRGFFITLEGGDGSGKSTQAAALARWLRRQGYAVCLTREPGGTRLGERVRGALLGHPAIDPWAELLLFQALRAQHVTEVLRPALARGAIVVCDRFADSTMAYQGYALGLDRALIARVTQLVTRGTTPDLTLILDRPAATGLRRARRRQAMERRGVVFQRRVRAGFLAIARREPRRCRLVPLRATPQATQATIQRLVQHALQRRHRS